MFVRVVVGRVADADRLQRQWDRWREELAPGAVGWLGSVGGVTADRRVVMAERFTSAEARNTHARRPEQAAWWSQAETCLDGPPDLLETGDVTAYEMHDSAAAGFVQVMRAAVRDRARLEVVEAEIAPAFFALRPDFLAGYRAWFPDGVLVAVDHFTSETEARAGESREMSDELAAGFREWLSLLERTEWFDLADPWVAAPEKR